MSVYEQKGSPPVVLRPGKYVRVSPLRLITLAAVVALPWMVVLKQTATHHRTSGPQPQFAATTTSPETVPASAPAALPLPAGPWGELTYTPITIEPPADSVLRFAAVDTSTWYFPQTTPAQLADLFQSAGLPDAQREALVRSATPDPQSNGLTVRPDRDTLASLSRDARTTIYRALARDLRNPHAEPFRHLGDPAVWLAGSGLSERTVALVRQYTYRRGDVEAFADLSAVLPDVADAAERAKLFRALASQPALNVRLRVRPDSDLAALVEYWGRAHHDRDVAPLLESLAKVPGGAGDTIDVAQLLPAFARARLNTFPPPVDLDGTVRGLFDCHWTTLNFWNAVPDNRFTDTTEAARQFQTAYRQVEKPTQLGDIVVLTDPAGQGIHSSVFIAADVALTKNGVSIAAPWILMRLPDITTYYETLGPLKPLTFRRKDL